MLSETDVYRIGTIGKPHGVRGEVTFAYTDDLWERADAEYLFVRVDGLLVPFFLNEYRLRGDASALLKLQDVDTPETARELCGAEVCLPRSLRPEGEDETQGLDQLLGFTLRDEERGDIGVIDGVDESTQNALFAVGALLVPAAEELISGIDHEARIVTMRLPEGLTEI